MSETTNGITTNYSYDDNGNVLSRIAGGTDTRFYGWDFENRLIGVDTDGNNTTDIHLQYDAAFGDRVSYMINGIETRFLIDTSSAFTQVLEEYTPSNETLKAYVYGNDVISQNKNGVSSWYHVDGLGSTRALTDISGSITDRYTFDAFGRKIEQTGNTDNVYQFAGERLDQNIEFYYLRARYYNQSSGRFIIMDPVDGNIFDPLSLHKYLYVRANPVNYIDPSGLQSFTMQEVQQVPVNIGILVENTGLRFLLYQLEQAATAVFILCTTAGAVSFSTALGSGNPCDITKFNILFSGIEMPETSIHIAEAIALKHKPGVLNRAYSGTNDRNWLRTSPECAGNYGRTKITGLWCDEYPFASTVEGGPGASLKLVPAWEQRLQGIELKGFYYACKIKAGDPIESKFGVIPVPLIMIPPWQCK
ncbi:MAG: hypothetical protein B6D35_08075 [Candidatus Brocadia sp. UTAMX2]|nr:MAG: hypothetical protein B6D35_08075 [Candidatus Brocadia sp. UTAMX2]